MTKKPASVIKMPVGETLVELDHAAIKKLSGESWETSGPFPYSRDGMRDLLRGIGITGGHLRTRLDRLLDFVGGLPMAPMKTEQFMRDYNNKTALLNGIEQIEALIPTFLDDIGKAKCLHNTGPYHAQLERDLEALSKLSEAMTIVRNRHRFTISDDENLTLTWHKYAKILADELRATYPVKDMAPVYRFVSVMASWITGEIVKVNTVQKHFERSHYVKMGSSTEDLS